MQQLHEPAVTLDAVAGSQKKPLVPKACPDAVDGSSPPDETDGPPGAVAMASMLQALGKRVTLVTDRRALQMYQDIMKEAVRTGDHWKSLGFTGSHWDSLGFTSMPAVLCVYCLFLVVLQVCWKPRCLWSRLRAAEPNLH